jgi:hypothetical protein
MTTNDVSLSATSRPAHGRLAASRELVDIAASSAIKEPEAN